MEVLGIEAFAGKGPTEVWWIEAWQGLRFGRYIVDRGFGWGGGASGGMSYSSCGWSGGAHEGLAYKVLVGPAGWRRYGKYLFCRGGGYGKGLADVT